MIEKYQIGRITLPNFTGQIISSQNTDYMPMSLKMLYGETANIILHFRRCDEVRNLERKSSTWQATELVTPEYAQTHAYAPG